MTNLQHTVLLVDDSPEDRLAYRRLLQHDSHISYACYEASTAGEALERCRELRPGAVLVDYMLPDDDGLALLAALIAEHGPHSMALLMLTGSGDEQLAVAAMKLGAHDYLPKGPQLGQQLSRAVASAIEKAALQREIARQRDALQASNSQLEQALATLSNERRLLEVTLASMGDGLIATDIDGRISFLNPAAEQITGWARSEAIGQPLAAVFAIVDEAQGTPLEDPLASALRNGEPCGVVSQAALIARDGREIPIDHNATPIRQDSGAIEGVVLVFRDVSAHKQAETALRRNERMLMLFIEHAPAAIAMFDREMNYIAASRRYLADYQLADQNIVGRSHYQLFPEIPERWKEIHRRCLAGAIEKSDEDPFPRADGMLDWVRWEIHPWYEHSSEIGGLVLFSEVITERKQAEQALRQSDEHLALAIHSGNIGLWDWDLTLNKVYYSREWKAQLGFENHEITDNFAEWESRVHPDDIERAKATIGEYLANPYPNYQNEFRMRHRDGSYHWILAQASLLTDEQERPVRMMGSHIDITERKQAEQALRESEERLRTVTDSAQVGLVIVDQQHHYRYANRTYADIFSLPTADIVGQHVADVLAPVYETQIRPRLIRAFGGERVSYDLIFPPATPGEQERYYAVKYETGLYHSETVVIVVVVDITERKQAEMQLRYQAELLEHVSDAIISVDRSFAIRSWNTAAEALYGWAAQEVMGRTMAEILPTKYLDSDMHQSQAALLEHGRWQGEVIQPHRDGTPRTILSSVSLLKDSAGNMAGAVGINHDITERKRAELALRQSEERFSKAFGASPAALAISRASDRRFIDVNESLQRLLGYTHDELVGHSSLEFNIYHYPAELAAVVQEMRDKGRAHNHEITIRAKSGELRQVLFSSEAIEVGEEACFLTILYDITERKRTELALRQSEARLQVLADASRTFAEASVDERKLLDQVARICAEQIDAGCVVNMVSDDGQWVNVIAVYDQDPAVQSTIRTFFSHFRVHVDSPYNTATVLRTGQPIFMPVIDLDALRASLPPELRLVVTQLNPRSTIIVPLKVQGKIIGSLWLTRHKPEQTPFDEEDLRLVQDLADRAALAIENARLLAQVQHELAERTKAESEVRALNQDLEQRVAARTAQLEAANKELEAFSYSVSHDLRAPLRAIDGFSRILLEEYVASLPDDAQEYFNLIRSNTQQMGHLVDDLLAFSRLSRQPLNKRPVDTIALIRQCLQELSDEQAGRQVEIALDTLPECSGDAALLKQVWLNLLANALKYTRRRDPATIEIGSQEAGEETVYFVKDNGVGFDMRYVDKLFGVFQRMHRAEEYEGTGVGLAIVQRIVQRHGGRVWADAAPNQGATFYFTLEGEKP